MRRNPKYMISGEYIQPIERHDHIAEERIDGQLELELGRKGRVDATATRTYKRQRSLCKETALSGGELPASSLKALSGLTVERLAEVRLRGRTEDVGMSARGSRVRPKAFSQLTSSASSRV